MKNIYPLILYLHLLALAAPADDTVYVRHFNIDEFRLDDQPVSTQNWNHHYGAGAANAEGDPNFVQNGISEGPSSTDALALSVFRNAPSRGFLFGSGTGSFPPGAHFFWTTHLDTNASDVPGNKDTFTFETDWGTLSDAPLAGHTVVELAGLGALIRPRNAVNRYRLAFQLDGGPWCVDAAGAVSTDVNAWQPYEIADVQAMNVYTNLDFVPDVSLNLDLPGTGSPVPVSALASNAVVTGYGMYIDTDARSGQTDTWCRMDSFYVRTTTQLEIPIPVISEISVGNATVAVDVSSRFGFTYRLERTDEPGVDFSPVLSSETVATSGGLQLLDAEHPPTNATLAAYSVRATADQE